MINDGTFTTATNGQVYPNSALGNVLTVTQAALVGAKPAVGQTVMGPAVATGTRIKSYLGTISLDDWKPGSYEWDQYELEVCDSWSGECGSKAQSSIGGGYVGQQPRLTAYDAGAYLSTTIGAQGNLTLHAGFLDGIPIVGSGMLAVDAKIPLYSFNATWDLGTGVDE